MKPASSSSLIIDWILTLISIGCFVISPLPRVASQPPDAAADEHLHVGEGAVRLIGGTVRQTGDLLIHHNGTWGLVCDDSWDKEAAVVACRMLGFPDALAFSTQAHFGATEREYDIILDDVQCYGDEASLLACSHRPWGDHNCGKREAAGVYCAAQASTNATTSSAATLTTTATTTTTTTQQHETTSRPNSERGRPAAGPNPQPQVNSPSPEHLKEINELRARSHQIIETHARPNLKPKKYRLRLGDGRNENEGRVEVLYRGHWGAICSNRWTLLEALVVCKELSLGYAQMAVKSDAFGGASVNKVFGGIQCDGTEDRLANCYHHQVGSDVVCPEKAMVAGVVCARALPDLVPNATLVQYSSYLEDRPLIYLQCAMEEGCASSGAYEVIKHQRDWGIQSRRLFRFSSSTWNFGTLDFRPFLDKYNWEWHLCHMHYHSMQVFAHYDLVDKHGNQVAEGHKASFCLEDVECLPEVEKHYACKGFGDQGISVGCADNYLHDIDCQWIDITDVPPGYYIFRMHINPEFLVAELSYENNAVTCNVQYTGYQLFVTNCVLGRGH